MSKNMMLVPVTSGSQMHGVSGTGNDTVVRGLEGRGDVKSSVGVVWQVEGVRLPTGHNNNYIYVLRVCNTCMIDGGKGGMARKCERSPSKVPTWRIRYMSGFREPWHCT
jgi:hypothetical protein